MYFVILEWLFFLECLKIGDFPSNFQLKSNNSLVSLTCILLIEPCSYIDMFYLNTIEQLFLFVEQLDQLGDCLPYHRLLTGITILAVFQNLRWNSNKTSLIENKFKLIVRKWTEMMLRPSISLRHNNTFLLQHSTGFNTQCRRGKNVWLVERNMPFKV